MKENQKAIENAEKIWKECAGMTLKDAVKKHQTKDLELYMCHMIEEAFAFAFVLVYIKSEDLKRTVKIILAHDDYNKLTACGFNKFVMNVMCLKYDKLYSLPDFLLKLSDFCNHTYNND